MRRRSSQWFAPTVRRGALAGRYGWSLPRLSGTASSNRFGVSEYESSCATTTSGRGEKVWCVPELTDEYIERMEDLLDLYEQPLRKGEPVVCLDERPVQL